jgi:hypothetical protein
LDINPVTFTPEYLLHLARVVRLAGELVFIIQRIPRPGARAISFGTMEEDPQAVEETVAWDQVLSEGWRIAA